jgi:hypothetical protein
MHKTLNIKFKGDRKYLHGTDIFNAFLDITGPINNLTIKFHKKVTNNLIAYSMDLESLEKFRLLNKISVLMTYEQLNLKKVVVAIETSKKVIGHNEYIEDYVIADSEIIGHKIIQDRHKEGAFIERIVALNKKLLNHLFGLQAWFFTQLYLNENYSNNVKLSIEFDRSIGALIHRSVLIIDGKKAGYIIFSKHK